MSVIPPPMTDMSDGARRQAERSHNRWLSGIVERIGAPQGGVSGERVPSPPPSIPPHFPENFALPHKDPPMIPQADTITGAMTRVLRERVEEVLAEEIASAQRRIAERIRKEADALALQVLDRYSIHDMGTRIIIEVRKPNDGSRQAGD
jgi:hypothetical protein